MVQPKVTQSMDVKHTATSTKLNCADKMTLALEFNENEGKNITLF